MFLCKPYKNQKGIVLILVLIVMQMMMWFTMLALESNLYLQKMSRSEWRQGLLLNDALNILHHVEEQITLEWPKCKLEWIRNPIKESLIFWQSEQTCAGNFNHLKYYYVAEEIGHDSCAERAIIYLRVTLLVINEQMSIRSLLQSVLTIPDVIQKTCEGSIHHVKMGHQLWREIQ